MGDQSTGYRESFVMDESDFLEELIQKKISRLVVVMTSEAVPLSVKSSNFDSFSMTELSS